MSYCIGYDVGTAYAESVIAWLRFIGGGGELALSSVGKVIVECVKNGK